MGINRAVGISRSRCRWYQRHRCRRFGVREGLLRTPAASPWTCFCIRRCFPARLWFMRRYFSSWRIRLPWYTSDSFRCLFRFHWLQADNSSLPFPSTAKRCFCILSAAASGNACKSVLNPFASKEKVKKRSVVKDSVCIGAIRELFLTSSCSRRLTGRIIARLIYIHILIIYIMNKAKRQISSSTRQLLIIYLLRR